MNNDILMKDDNNPYLRSCIRLQLKREIEENVMYVYARVRPGAEQERAHLFVEREVGDVNGTRTAEDFVWNPLNPTG